MKSLVNSTKLLAFGSKVLASNLGYEPHPYKLTFSCTYRCNSKCTLCSIWQKPLQNELTVTEIDTFFKINPYFSWIQLTGGEITLRRDIKQIVDSIFEHSLDLFFFHFPTNCLQPKKVLELAQHILDKNPPKFSITLSLDGDEMLHDSLRGVKGNWQRVIQTYALLKPLLNSRFTVVFGVTISAANVDHLKKLMSAAKEKFPELSWTDFHFNLAHYSSHYYGNTADAASDKKVADKTVTALAEFDAHKPIGWWLNAERWLDAKYRSFAQEYYQKKKTPLPCKSLTSSVFIDNIGDCYACAMWSKKLGNLRDLDFKLDSFWNTPETQRVRELIALKKCSNCWTPCEAYQTMLGNLPQVLFHKT